MASAFEIEYHALMKSGEISREFRDVFAYSTDVIKIVTNAFKKQDEFLNFINSDPAEGIWIWGTGQTSLVIMVLTAYGTAWEMLMTTIKDKTDWQAVCDLYGLVLSCFIEDGTLTYSIDDVAQLKDAAERKCAIKLRNAVAHNHMTVVKQSPWTIEFRTNWKKEKHSFQITPKGLCRFLGLFNNFSRFGYITKDSITTMLEMQVSENTDNPQKLKDLFGKK
jgi:hypothetical protein